MKNLAPVLAALLLAACAAPAPEYKPDLAGKPTATLQLSSLHPSPVQVGALTGQCVPFTAKEFGAKTMAMGLLNGKQPAERQVLAGEPITLAFFTSTTTVSGQMATDTNCAIGMRFTPEAGAEYEAVFTGDSDNCRLDLGKLSGSSGSVRPTPVPGATAIKSCE
jgi:hypothetical protein